MAGSEDLLVVSLQRELPRCIKTSAANLPSLAFAGVIFLIDTGWTQELQPGTKLPLFQPTICRQRNALFLAETGRT